VDNQASSRAYGSAGVGGSLIIGQLGVWSAGDTVCVRPRSLAQPQYDTIRCELTVQASISARGRLSQRPRIPSYYCTYAPYSGHTKRRRDSTGTVGHRATGWRPVVCSVVDNGMGNHGTEDGTAWADVQAIFSCF